MQLIRKPKYLLKFMFNYNEIRYISQMKSTLLDKHSYANEKKNKIKRYTRLFIDEIGMKESEVQYLLRNNDKIFEIDENRILQNIRICKVKKHTISIFNICFNYLCFFFLFSHSNFYSFVSESKYQCAQE